MLCNTTGDTYEVKMNWARLVLESCFETCAVLKCKELCCIFLIHIFIHILGNDNVLWYDGMLTFHMHRQSPHSVTYVILILLVLCHGACRDVHTNSPMIMPVFPCVPWCGITNMGQSKIWSSLGTGCGSYFLAQCYTVWFGRQVLMFLKKLLPPYFSVYRTSHVAPAALHSTHSSLLPDKYHVLSINKPLVQV
jgi:hypothetical protein